MDFLFKHLWPSAAHHANLGARTTQPATVSFSNIFLSDSRPADRFRITGLQYMQEVTYLEINCRLFFSPTKMETHHETAFFVVDLFVVCMQNLTES